MKFCNCTEIPQAALLNLSCESDRGTAQLLETRAGSFPVKLPTFQLQQLDNQKGFCVCCDCC